MAKHSSIGASSAYRWFECPASVRMSVNAPPQEDTIYAKQGTAAHWVVDQFFKAWQKDQTIDLYSYVGLPAPNGYELEDEDIEAVEKFVNFVLDLLKEGKYILHSEAEFELSAIYDGLFGTSDIVMMESNMKRLKVIDYKHGSGIPVEVVDNKQLLYYALGAILFACKKHGIGLLDVMGWGHVFSEVEIIVAQPRCRHKDGAFRRWVIPAAKLEAFALELAQKAKETSKKDAPFKVGDHCRFCPALATCPAFNNKTFELAQADFKGVSHPSNLNLPAPEALTVHQIKKIMDFADLIAAFLKAVEANALHRMNHGEVIEGYKLVKKKSNRDWKNEDEAKETLSLYVKEEDLFEKKFLSPAKAEKLGKDVKKAVETLTFKPDNGSTIAPEHDPREAIEGTAVSDFADMSK